MKKPRRLKPNEEDLWLTIASQITPLRPARAKLTKSIPQHDKPLKPKQHQSHQPRGGFRIGEKSKPIPESRDLKPSLPEQMARERVQMDGKKYKRMKQGREAPQAKIDLHGMTMAQAHPVLMGFILDAFDDGKRLVLVVTGKGKHRDEPGPIPVPYGVLKHQVPQWLSMPPLRSAVLQVAQAHRKHGGEGAYYVYLRRQR
ncbi:Smr/MutS family protein [Falsihalocynthiibacter sp. SS001]|uniref:Smr/MutS family protein n=1 Tax=Falsihalocynthiibacter sp. SS001 TaxID=3349698 RepID=UPI0036D24F9D